MWRVWVPLIAVAFLAIVVWFTGSGALLPVTIPAVALITFLNLRSTRFCDGCGRTVYTQNLLKPARYCPHCGALLDPQRQGE